MTFRSSALLFVVVSLAPLSALAQRCDTAALSDTVCDCGCGTTDSACNGAPTFAACATNHCPAGEVPWEHAPSSCMSSACGDGWKDPASGEACDDGNALAGGGCSADCHTVTAGYTCGEGAAGCRLTPDAGAHDAGPGPVDAGSQAPDSGTTLETDAGVTPTHGPTGGCSTVPGSALALAALLGLRRRSAAS